MRLATLSLAALAGTFLLATANANAMTCYIKYDRNDNVVYRDIRPPVDMSENGTAARAAMRQRGEYLVFMETDECPGVIFNLGAGVSGAISVDEIVSSYRSYGGPQAGITRSTNPGGVQTGGATRTGPAAR